MRRRTVWLLGAALLAGLTLCWVLWPAPFSVRAFERIRLGMTMAEVETAIGTPPIADFAPPLSIMPFGPCLRQSGISLQAAKDAETDVFLALSQRVHVEYWRFDDCCLAVAFDEGRVAGIYLFDVSELTLSFFDRVRAWLCL